MNTKSKTVPFYRVIVIGGGFAGLGAAIKLKQAGGFLALTDKTDAEIIYDQLGMSKKAFKKAIGGLFKNGQLSIDNDGLRLTEMAE